VTLVNRGDRLREIEVTSFVEVVLAPPADDVSHPAFLKLFLETEYLPTARRCCAGGGRARRTTPRPGRCT
jgi:cyclic beta-1,2-glucan synthetase